MDNMLTQLNIMIDGLKRKENALQEVLSITDNQQTVIKSELPLDEVRNLVFSMNEEKQSAIKVVISCDDMFEKMLKEMGHELDAKQDQYKPQVKIMQDYIRKVMDLDVKIRLGEEENNRLMDERRTAEMPAHGLKPKQSTILPDSKKVIQAYEQGSKNYKG